MKNFLNLNLKCSVWLLLLLFGATTAAQAQGTRASDSLELVALYNATGGANWINRTNWLTNNPIDTWFGVTLTNGRVTSLDLHSNQLSDSIPNLNLPNLTVLRIYGNQLRGSIPNFNLPNLQYLELGGSQLSGSIPNFNLPNLRKLTLSLNQLNGSIPNFNLPNLQDLYLDNNQLSGSIPNFNLPNLQYLMLYTNQLRGSIPNFNLPNLQYLNLSYNQLSGSIPNFNLPNLQMLYLQDNQLSGCVPSGIKTNCPRIGSSNGNISNNPNLSTQNWASYWNSNVGACVNCYTTPTPQYRTIRQGDSVVVNNHVYRTSGTYQDTIIRSGLCDSIVVTQLTVLSTVTMPPITALQCGNRNYRLPSGRIVSAIGTYQDTVRPIALLSDTAYTFRLIADTTGRCSDSTELVTFYNATSGANWTNRTNWLTNNPINTWFGVTLTNGRVTSLSLHSNQLSGSIPNLNLPNLKELSLLYNQLSGSIPNFNLPNLEKLWLNNNQLSGSIPNFNLPNLQQLVLGTNQLSGNVLNFNLPNLQYLLLGGNQLNGTIPNFNLPNLQQLSLLSNQLNGTIPNFNLPNLQHLSLSYNQLNGSIPNFNLPNLRELVLNNNQLSGNVPNFNLPNLEKLRLNTNQLSGNISNFNFPNLQQLILDSNLFSGSIPNFTTALTYMAVQYNQFNFGSIENRTWLTQTMQTKTYSPQAKIRLSYQNNKLAMSVGGTVAQETFKWYRNDTLVTTMMGDSTFTPTLNGSYRCEATHSGIPNLTLISLDTLLTAVNCNLSASIIRNGNTLTATATGGRGTYRFLWNNQATTQAINNITTGNNYQVTVTDSLGCVATAAISIPQVEPYKIFTQGVYCNSQQSWLVINMNDYRSCIDAMQIKVTFDTSKIILGANNSIIRGSALPNNPSLSFPLAASNELNINIDVIDCITGNRDTNLLKIPFRLKPAYALPNVNISFTVSIKEMRVNSTIDVQAIYRDTFKVTPNIVGVVKVVKPNGAVITGKERPLSIYVGDTCTNHTRKIDWDTLRQAVIVPLDSFRYFHLVRASLPRIPQIGNTPYIIGTDDAAMLRAYLTDSTRNPLTARQRLAANVITDDGLTPLDVTTIRRRVIGMYSRFDTLLRNRRNLTSDYIFTRLNNWQIDTCQILPTQSISCDTPSLTMTMVTLGDIDANGDTITHLIGNQEIGQTKHNSTKLIFDMCRGTQESDGYKIPVFANAISTSLDLQLLNLPNSIRLSFDGSSHFSIMDNQINNSHYISGIIEDTTKVGAWQPLFYMKLLGQQNVHKSMLGTINVFHNGQLANYEVYEKSVHCVSTQELAENPFEIYPNPTTGSIQMTTQQPLSEHTTLRIYDMLGRNVKTVVLQQGSSNFTIDISEVANGVYQFHFANQYKKVVKQ